MQESNYNTVEVEGINFSYYREGKGEVMLLLHGITTNSFIWKEMIPHFSSAYDVIVPDLLGCGKSSKRLDVDYSIKNQAELMAKLVKTLGLSKVHLVCHDIGGGIGQIMAVRHPEILHDLCLLNSVGYDFWPVQPISTMRTPILRQIAMATLDMGTLRLIVKSGLYHKEKLTPEIFALFEDQMENKANRKSFLKLAKDLNNNDLLEIEQEIGKLNLDVLIIRGETDVYLSKAIAMKLHKNIQNSRLELIETAGHFAQIDEPEKISKLILQFYNHK
jgi:pimeloyl-ACP methyl ester carboxylesterase